MFDLTLARPTNAAPPDDSFNAVACSIDKRERRSILLAACVAGLSVLSAALPLFVEGANSPWLDASFDLTMATQSCEAIAISRQRDECQREMVQAAARLASPPPVRVRH